MTARCKPPPARIYRREAYPVARPALTAMTHDDAKWAQWSDGDDYVVNTGGEVRLYAGDITWREVPFNPADRTPDPAPTPTPRPAAALADHARKLAADYDLKARDIVDGDGRYGGLLVDEMVGHLTALAAELATLDTATPADHRPENPHPGVVVAAARTAARSVVEYVADEGWFPLDGKTDVPDACADAVLAALARAGLLAPPSDTTRGA